MNRWNCVLHRRFVIDTILKNGYCSTEDLKNGGYEHAPRAARDVIYIAKHILQNCSSQIIAYHMK